MGTFVRWVICMHITLCRNGAFIGSILPSSISEQLHFKPMQIRKKNWVLFVEFGITDSLLLRRGKVLDWDGSLLQINVEIHWLSCSAVLLTLHTNLYTLFQLCYAHLARGTCVDGHCQKQSPNSYTGLSAPYVLPIEITHLSLSLLGLQAKIYCSSLPHSSRSCYNLPSHQCSCPHAVSASLVGRSQLHLSLKYSTMSIQ